MLFWVYKKLKAWWSTNHIRCPSRWWARSASRLCGAGREGGGRWWMGSFSQQACRGLSLQSSGIIIYGTVLLSWRLQVHRILALSYLFEKGVVIGSLFLGRAPLDHQAIACRTSSILLSTVTLDLSPRPSISSSSLSSSKPSAPSSYSGSFPFFVIRICESNCVL